ncbi:carbohydrate sulfotransferase 9-like [Rana temporaria]|uniref:carbohydrate sulfotransferase 9-like n=1 Tax=Rana temporaria TaxID=8407 RepID=UPI001AAD962E|nr:carbohydrate sulfotransferase 9-like [Rana temporaria]
MKHVTPKKLFLYAIFSVSCVLILHIKWTEFYSFIYPTPLEVIYKHRQSVVKFVCERNNLTNISHKLNKKISAQLFVEHSHRFIYCEVPKVGCSNWKRIILLLNRSLQLSLSKLKHYEVHTSPLLRKLSSYSLARQKKFLANYTKVMFVRDPLERVVSAYRDKFLHDDDVYYSKVYANIIRKRLGINVNSTEHITFTEFVHFISQEEPYYRDTHWKPMYHLCDPCNIQYDIIGKFESINQDADFVLKTIGAPKDLKYPTMKHHSNDSRTSEEITKQYLETLPPKLYRQLLDVYSADFSMFEYSYYKIFGNETTPIY